MADMKGRQLFKDSIVRILAFVMIAIALITGQITASDLFVTTSVPNVSEGAYDAALTTWTPELAPDFVVRCGAAQIPEQASALAPAKTLYESDELGRPALAAGNVTYQMRKDGADRERDDLPNPVGWPKNAEVTIRFPKGGTYHGWLWNRSHLLAKSLGGEDTKQNLVSGTRCQNVGKNDGDGGMALTETLARDWIDTHRSGTLIYCAIPVYVDAEPIPRAVIVEMRSSDGTLDGEYVVYNAAPGFTIDYANATWSQDDAQTQTYDVGKSILEILRTFGIEL